MKTGRLALVVIIALCLTTLSFAQQFHTANSITVAWDAPQFLDDGTTPVDLAEISYKIYIANYITDPTKQNPVEIGTTTNTQYTITLNTEGQYLYGISSVRTVGGTEIGESAIAWSDDPNAATTPHGIQHFLLPSTPSNLRVQ